jgi:cytochrome c oxidase subunit II
VRARAGLRAVAAIGAAVHLAGCTRLPAALTPGGPQADRIGHLWWGLLALLAGIYALVIAVLALGVRREPDPDDGPTAFAAEESRLTRVVAGATIVTAAILVGILAFDLLTGRALAALPTGNPDAVAIRVTGHQWWWEVEYEDASPSERFLTANEIHVPVGRPVKLTLTSGDVIHSFWVPSLHGKRDLIPGRTTLLGIQADREGVYDGRCAEFCGLQHAHMGLRVIAESSERFEAWRRAQRAPAGEPSNPEAARGRELFPAMPCAMCHTVRGTPAAGTTAPDLTHVAARTTLAAGLLPNTRGHLAGWIADPQQIKPGTRMPANALQPDELQALVSYLQGLD